MYKDGSGAKQRPEFDSQNRPPTPLESEITHEINKAKEVDNMTGLRIPTHPIPCMQAPFAESMREAGHSAPPESMPDRGATAQQRRQVLLDQESMEDTQTSRWRQRPGQKHHELWKLIAQISFGSYLLFDGIAKDNEQVLAILQGHVDEVDNFLETTLEDFDYAQTDVDERLRCLKIPLANIEIFDQMLEDRSFRSSIVEGNERIEHVITRTAAAMNDALKDVQQGMSATREFGAWLSDIHDDSLWAGHRLEMEKVYEAMKGNADGWHKAYISLQTKGNHLGIALVQLGSIVAEMDRRAGEISRKTRFSIIPGSTPTSPASPARSTSSPFDRSHSHRSKPSTASSNMRNLPEPNTISPAIRATIPVFKYVAEREQTPEEAERLDADPEKLSAFTLQPRTYSPAPRTPSPRRAEAEVKEQPVMVLSAVPEPKKKASLRKKFSEIRKNSLSTEAASDSRVTTPPLSPVPHQQTLLEKSDPLANLRPISPPNGERITYKRSNDSSTRSHFQGPDSAYCSDADKVTTPYSESQFSHPAQDIRPLRPGYIASPRSDQQYFRPVQASPNSPLQRPWTAAPRNHSPINHAASNESMREHSMRDKYSRAPSSMSQMTSMTMMTEGGTKLKKKRSGFGWLKKAFSLSEEEKAEYEKRRRQPVENQYQRAEKSPYLDGRRVDGERGRYVR